MMSAAQAKDLLLSAYRDWTEDEAPRLGAALAFYTILSLAPLLIITIAIAGMVFGREAAQGQLTAQFSNLIGTDGAKAIEGMIAGASKKSSGIVASLLGLLTLVWGATSVVTELRNAMNRIWEVPGKQDTGVKDLVKERSYAFALVLGCGFLLIAALVVSAAVATVGKFIGQALPAPKLVLHLLDIVVSLIAMTGVFALLFRFLPDITLEWRDVLVGAAFTAVLFTVGKVLIGLYLGQAGFGSTFAAAGSVVIVIVWVYYSAQLFFFGAEVTQVYAHEHGSKAHGTEDRREAPHHGRPELVHTKTDASRALPPSVVSSDSGDKQKPGLAAVFGGVAVIGAHFIGVFRRSRR